MIGPSTTKSALAALLSGFVFAIGLGISGMTLPEKVIGFLDVSGGKWDPALAFVMGGAVIVYGIGFKLITRREAPVFANKFSLPTRKDIDTRLILGAVLFSAGWGLGGFCPGPALTSLATLAPQVLIFVAAMLVGMFLFSFIDGRGKSS